jgi:hypothetical protein
MGGDPTQEEIEEHMCSLDHVKQLRVSIESNGGLIDPLIVRDGDLTVLEGNSRLAAYRILCAHDPVKWGKVRCKVLPADINDSAVFALLGQYHIIGRKDWEPFEQAHYLYRRHMQTKIPVAYMAQELGISKQKAEKMIQVIEFMIEHDDLNKRHWSYYEEYLKNASIKRYRQTNPDIDDTMAEAIKTDVIKEAADMRMLGQIAAVGDKQSKKIMQQIADGIMLEDGEIHADAISYVSPTDRKQAGIEIHSGKNRIVRRIFESLGYHVVKLDRVYFAGLTKKDLPRGRWRYLTQDEVNFLKQGSFE